MKPTPEELQLDALREVANVGAGHAARALSELTGGRRMSMDIPRSMKVDATGLADLLGGDKAPVVAASFQMSGAMSGRMLVVWSEADAVRLKSFLNHGEPEGKIATSALSEAANIVASACLNAVGKLAGLRLLPSTPTLHSGTAGEVARDAITEAYAPEGKGWVLAVRLFSEDMSNELLLVPDSAGMSSLLKHLGV